MKVIVATHNKNKVKEISEILKDTNIELISLLDLNDDEDIIEDGDTFFDNAMIKAKHVSLKYNMPAIADDSGLEIYALNNEPGINSSRYSGKGDYYNNLKVLKELEGVINRGARFITELIFYYPSGEYNRFSGIWKGNIGYSMKGSNGFGYDPIFIPNGYDKTVAELSEEVKKNESHRAKALQSLKKHYNI